MRYNGNAVGPIDRNKFTRSYAQKLMRNHIDGKISKFLNPCFRLKSHPFKSGDKYPLGLYVNNGEHGIILGIYQPRLIIQHHRFWIFFPPDLITNFFGLSFDDYLALYEIEDKVDAILARIRWG